MTDSARRQSVEVGVVLGVLLYARDSSRGLEGDGPDLSEPARGMWMHGTRGARPVHGYFIIANRGQQPILTKVSRKRTSERACLLHSLVLPRALFLFRLINQAVMCTSSSATSDTMASPGEEATHHFMCIRADTCQRSIGTQAVPEKQFIVRRLASIIHQASPWLSVAHV